MELPELRRSGPIAWREAGSGPVLVLLHGLGGSSKTWAEQYRAFAPTHRVIGWDAPGFGASEALAEADADLWADALAGLMDRLGVATAALLGHSMGGVIAPRVAARHPGRIERLILSATRASFAGPSGFDDRQHEFDTLSDAERGRSRAAAMAAPGAAPEVLARLAGIAAEVTREAFRGGAALLARADNRDILKALDMAALVVCGAADRIAPPERAEEIARLLPSARLARIEGAGHAAYAEAPADYNRLLADFLAE